MLHHDVEHDRADVGATRFDGPGPARRDDGFHRCGNLARGLVDSTRMTALKAPFPWLRLPHSCDTIRVVLMTREQRFWAKVKKTAKCWLWTASYRHKGYGAFAYRERGVNVNDRAHRFSWRIHYGEIPDGLLVLHRCDTPACVRPDHLFLGTHQVNVDDMIAKGRLNHMRRSVESGSRFARGEQHHNAKLSEAKVQDLCRRRSQGEPYSALARAFIISISQAWRIAHRQQWRHVR